METIICYVGGRAQGNPGLAAFGVYVTDEEGRLLCEVAKGIGNGTNDFATYHAVMVGLQTLQEMFGPESLTVQVELKIDNELIKKQLNAELPINEPGLVPMFIEIHNLCVANFPNLHFELISRDENMEVNRLVHEILDGKG